MDLRNVIKSRKTRDMLMYGLFFLPDALYVKLFYFAINGRFPNLKNPKRYTDKLQWLKLYDRHKEYSLLADKIEVKKNVEQIIGEGYVFPILGKWKAFKDIDFNELPNSFVLKCNHDSGSTRIIRDKNLLTEKEINDLEKYYNNRLKKNYYYAGREECYKYIEPFVFAEALMSSDDIGGIKDYKFFCFEGIPKLMLMVSGRQSTRHEDYFDMDFNWLHIQNGHTESDHCPEKPRSFEKMKAVASKLSEGLKHVRVDLYEIDGKVYFGEYTFFNGGGFEVFKPDEWELKLGNWIDLNYTKKWGGIE